MDLKVTNISITQFRIGKVINMIKFFGWNANPSEEETFLLLINIARIIKNNFLRIMLQTNTQSKTHLTLPLKLLNRIPAVIIMIYTHFDSFLPDTYKIGMIYTLVNRC